MTAGNDNDLMFHCEVVEIISSGDKRVVKVMCNPGALILKIPNNLNARLGDQLKVSGTFKTEHVEAKT